MAQVDAAAQRHTRAGGLDGGIFRHVLAAVPLRPVERVEIESPVDPLVAAERAARQLHFHDVVERSVAAERLRPSVAEKVKRETETGSDLVLEVEVDRLRAGRARRRVGWNRFGFRAYADVQREAVLHRGPGVLQEESFDLVLNVPGSLTCVHACRAVLSASGAELADAVPAGGHEIVLLTRENVILDVVELNAALDAVRAGQIAEPGCVQVDV